MLTVFFATCNRATILQAVLERYCGLHSPAGGWRLVVVDNGSQDGTREVAMRYTDRLPLTYLFERRRGKNAALNTGLQAAQGDLLVFTDDDVFPCPDWLCSLRAAADAQPRYGMFGGPILPRWEIPPAQWILDWVFMEPVFALTSPNLAEGPINPVKIFGPNMAIRAEALATERFDPSIGPRGAQYAMGSETELIKRLAKRGYLGWHVKSATVEHFIRRSQLTRKWILGRAVRYGRGEYRLAQASAPARNAGTLWGVPQDVYTAAMKQSLRLLISTLKLDAQDRFHARWELNYLYGRAVEARLMMRSVVSPTGVRQEL